MILSDHSCLVSQFMKTRIFLSILILSATLILNKGAFAIEQDVTEPTIPTFPSCQIPQGELKAFYPNGTHGIPGSSSEYTGSDAVYFLTEETLAQCFCPVGGEGIQTNWWKVSELTIEQIESLVADGWIYVPNGAEWGLDEAPYLAKNETYVCAGGIGGPREPDDDDDDDDDDDNDDKDDDDKDEESKEQEGSVLGGAVLAATGNTRTIALYLALALAFLSAAMVSYKRHAKSK